MKELTLYNFHDGSCSFYGRIFIDIYKLVKKFIKILTNCRSNHNRSSVPNHSVTPSTTPDSSPLEQVPACSSSCLEQVNSGQHSELERQSNPFVKKKYELD